MFLTGSGNVTPETNSVWMRRREEFFQRIYQQLAMGIAITDWQGVFQECNPAYCALLGYTEEELRTIDFSSLIHPEDREANLVQVRRLQVGEIPSFDIENRYIRKSGEPVWVHKFVSVLHGEEGEPTHLIALVTNITERKLADEARLRHFAIVESSDDAIIGTDMIGTVTDWNKGAEKVFGYSAKEAVGKSISILSPPDRSEDGKNILKKVLNGEVVKQYETVRRRKDGALIDVSITLSPTVGAEGKIVGASGIGRDITERRRAEEALRESEERLRLAVQAGKMYAYEWDIKTDVLVRSPEYVNVLDATEPRSLTHQQVLEKIHPDDRPKLLAAIARHSLENPTVDVTYRVLLPGKPPVWVKSSGRAFFDGEGRMLRVIGMVADVTDQKLGEEALRVSEQRLRLAQQAARIGSFERDLRTGQITWAEGLEPLYGLSPGSLHGKTPEFVKDLIHPTDRQRVAQLIQQALKTGQPTEGEWRAIWPDGSVHWIVSRWQVLMDHSGEPLRVVGVNLDITDRKRVEEAVRESETRFRLVADAAPVMIWMSGVDKKPTYFNQLWLDFTGRSEADLQAGLAGVVHPEDYEKWSEIYRKAFDQRQPLRRECRLRKHDGQYRWTLDIGVPRFLEDGSFAGYIGSSVDITDRKHAEEALASVNRRLIEAQDQECSRIARELHDDLGQRLALLMIEMDQLSQSLNDPHKCRGRMGELQKLTSELATDMQSLSHRLHSSRLELQGVAAAMNGYCKEFSRLRSVEVDFRSSNLPSPVPREISLCLYRVLQEALSNSAKHSGVRHYEAHLWATREEIHLTVKDSGKGFDTEMAVTSHGLGIVSMRERLTLVGGQLSIQSQPTLGTTIHACVPLNQGEPSWIL